MFNKRLNLFWEQGGRQFESNRPEQRERNVTVLSRSADSGFHYELLLSSG